MKALRTTFAAAIGVAALLLAAAPAHAAPAHAAPMSNTTCASGTIASGTYNNLTVTGVCTIPDGANVTVRGHLTLAAGSELKAVTASTVMIRGNVLVGPGAKLGLGCSEALTLPAFPGGPTICPNGVSHDQVKGSIVANQPLTLLLDGLTIHGNLVSVGGGVPVPGDNPGCEEMGGALNFPVKDNVIHGNVHISGWQGCWFGFIRNVQHGPTSLMSIDTSSSDSNEIVTNTIHGSLVCLGNSPAPQVGDSHGEANMVTGHRIGQCASL
jgi:hypothetical protein